MNSTDLRVLKLFNNGYCDANLLYQKNLMITAHKS